MGLEPGETFGRYTIEGAIGAGGMGLVFRAHDNVLDRQVALKIIRPDQKEKEEACARFFREARLAARLTHPNTIRIYDLGEIEATPFIAMEYVDGQSLTVYAGLRDVPVDDAERSGAAEADGGVGGRKPPKNVERRLRWMLGIARGLEAAHAIGLVHRDVKLANMMVTADDIAKVLDFGLAKRRETSPRLRETFHTQAGFVVGTPMYMAPEQLDGVPVDARADQFAWGLATYLLLSGRNPRAIDPLLLGSITPLDAIVPGISAPVAAVVSRTMQRSREHRFENMTKTIAAFEEALSNLVVAPRVAPAARPGSRVPHGRPFYCPQCATSLDDDRRCARCGFVGKKPGAEPLRTVSKCPMTPDVAAISRDTLRVIAFGENGAAVYDGGWTKLALPDDILPETIRCAHFDIDGSLLFGGARGLCGRLSPSGTFTRWLSESEEAVLTACTSATASGVITFTGSKVRSVTEVNGVVVRVEAGVTSIFDTVRPLVSVALVEGMTHACSAPSAAGDVDVYAIERTSLTTLHRLMAYGPCTLVAASGDLFLAGAKGFVWRILRGGGFVKELLEDENEALLHIVSSPNGIWGTSREGRIYRRRDTTWQRAGDLGDTSRVIAARMLGRELVALLRNGTIVRSDRDDPPRAHDAPRPKPAREWSFVDDLALAPNAPFRRAAFSHDGRLAVAIGDGGVAWWNGTWRAIDPEHFPNTNATAFGVVRFDFGLRAIVGGKRAYAAGFDLGRVDRWFVGHSKATSTTFVGAALGAKGEILLTGVVEGGAGLFVRVHADGSTSALECPTPLTHVARTAAGHVFVAGPNGYLAKVDEMSISPLPPIAREATCMIAYGDEIFIGSADGLAFRIDAAGNAVRESTEAGSSILALATYRGIVFGATDHGHIVRRDPFAGPHRWRRITSDREKAKKLIALHVEDRGLVAIAEDGSRMRGTL